MVRNEAKPKEHDSPGRRGQSEAGKPVEVKERKRQSKESASAGEAVDVCFGSRASAQRGEPHSLGF